MKKLIMTTALVLGLCLGAFAEFNNEVNNEGLFRRGKAADESYFETGFIRFRDGNQPKPILPFHDLDIDQPADETPLGGGIAILLGLGAAYAYRKRNKE